MLNELSQVVDAVERLGATPPTRHPRINPMGKNKDLLVVCVSKNGTPIAVEVLKGKTAATLFRVEQGSAGSSFPGLNLPTPFCRLDSVPTEKLTPVVENLLALSKNKNSSNTALAEAIGQVFKLSTPRAFTASQEKQFQRSCWELTAYLRETLSAAPVGLTNFLSLLMTIDATKPTLTDFTSALARLLAKGDTEGGRSTFLLSQDVLFGVLDWKKRRAEIGSADYWREKAKHDKNANLPIYFDVADPNAAFKRVAHCEVSSLINEALLKADEAKAAAQTDETAEGVCAYSGRAEKLQDKFPSPKIAELGSLKLFSVNTREVPCLRRYGLEGSKAFPVSASLAQKMGDALLHLGSEQRRGTTCRAIPSAQPGKRDLLVAYLEGELELREQIAEMFGGETETFSDADFAAIAQPVIEMFEARVAANPNLNVRLLSFCSIDKGRKQISLNRQFHLVDVIRAAKDWQAGARNTPEVSVWFYDKNTKQSVFHTGTIPCPLELASTINRVWSADAKGGFSSTFQRAVSVSDAYDIFLAGPPLCRQKAESALGLLIARMNEVLATLGGVKNKREWIKNNKSTLSDIVRWQSLKAVALLGIILRQLGQHKGTFMHEPITEIGRLLALADSLHLQYCKHVRKDESPSQLIGNALFNTALDQPIFALARLAERLTPYQAWARTFRSNDPNAGVGLVKYFLAEIAACTAGIQLEQLPGRMSDSDKAKLLLGYLADHSKKEPENSNQH